MSSRRGDHALVQHEPDLLGQSLQRPRAAPLAPSTGGRRRRAARPPRGRPRSRAGRPTVLPDSARARSLGETANRSGNAACSVSRHVQRDRRARPAGAAGTGSSAGRAGRRRVRRPRTGCPRRRRAVISPRNRVSSRLTTNAGRVRDDHAVLLELLADGQGGGERGVVGRRAAHHLHQRQHGDRVEEVEADHPRRVRQAGRHRRHRQRGGVGGQHALRRDDRLDLGEHLLLDRQLLEDRLDDEVGVGERRPWTPSR